MRKLVMLVAMLVLASCESEPAGPMADGGGVQGRGGEWVGGRVEPEPDGGGCRDTVFVPTLDGSPLICPDPDHMLRIEHRGEHVIARCLCGDDAGI